MASADASAILNSPFLIASQEYRTYFLISPVSCFQRSNFLLLLTAVIAFFFSILWSLPFSRRTFVASTTRYGTVYYHSPVNATIPHHDSKTRTKEVACCLCVSTVHLSDTTTSSQPIDVANIRGSRSTTRPASLITSTFPLQLVATTFDWLKQRPCSYGCVLLVYAVCSKRQLDADRTLIECQNRSVVVNMARLRGRRPADLSQEPPHTTTQDHITLYQGTGRCRISHLYRYVCTVRTDRRPFLVPTSNPISCCFLSPGARY